MTAIADYNWGALVVGVLLTMLYVVCMRALALAKRGSDPESVQKPVRTLKRVECDCDCTDVCPQGRAGSQSRCIILKEDRR